MAVSFCLCIVSRLSPSVSAYSHGCPLLSLHSLTAVPFCLCIVSRLSPSVSAYSHGCPLLSLCYSHPLQYSTRGFLIYEEMRKYFPIYEEAVSHVWLCNCSTLNFLIYEENLIFFFISAGSFFICNKSFILHYILVHIAQSAHDKKKVCVIACQQAIVLFRLIFNLFAV